MEDINPLFCFHYERMLFLATCWLERFTNHTRRSSSFMSLDAVIDICGGVRCACLMKTQWRKLMEWRYIALEVAMGFMNLFTYFSTCSTLIETVCLKRQLFFRASSYKRHFCRSGHEMLLSWSRFVKRFGHSYEDDIHWIATSCIYRMWNVALEKECMFYRSNHDIAVQTGDLYSVLRYTHHEVGYRNDDNTTFECSLSWWKSIDNGGSAGDIRNEPYNYIIHEHVFVSRVNGMEVAPKAFSQCFLHIYNVQMYHLPRVNTIWRSRMKGIKGRNMTVLRHAMAFKWWCFMEA
jgi:hypothetical protein